MIQYEYFGEETDGKGGTVTRRRSTMLDDQHGRETVGQTTLLGWPVRQMYVRDRDGRMVSLVWFMTDTTGEVWRLFVDLH